jgi:glycosyltransferase involved in cell wall biosynthesis
VHDGTDAPPPYGGASLFLLPSHDENFGLSIAEAMAWGLPVVVTDTTPWREVNNREIGWCVPWAEYPDALRAAVQAPADVLRTKGEAARGWVRENFSWRRSAASLIAFCVELRRLPESTP